MPRYSLRSLMIVVAVAGFNLAVICGAIRIGLPRGSAGVYAVQAFGYLVGVQFFGPITAVLVAGWPHAEAKDRPGLALVLLFFGFLFVVSAWNILDLFLFQR